LSKSSSPAIGFISVTPSASFSMPWSTLSIGTTPRSSHRYDGTGLPPAWPSIVRSNRIAAMILSPVNAGALMMRTRISCMSLNISASPL
jgi:hypothetical protein